MIRETYLSIKHLIQPITELEIIDYDFQQWAEGGELIGSPAAFIGIEEIKTQPYGAHPELQQAVLGFTVTLVTEVADAGERSILDETLVDHLGIDRKIFQALQNQNVALSAITPQPPAEDLCIITDIARTAYRPPAIRQHLLLSQQRFTCTAYDASAVKSLQTVLATLEIQLRYVKSLTP